MSAPISHIIFDVDGLLLDTERLYSQITQDIVSKYGKNFTWAIKSQQMGKKETEASKIIIDELELPLTVEEYLALAHKEQEVLFPKVDFMPGAEKLVRHFHKHNIPIAIATGSSQHLMDLKTRNHKDFFSLFLHSVVSTDDPEVKHGKPAPDIFRICAKRFKENPIPEKVLVFEDAPNGVDAAHAAGMRCVWVPHEEQDRNTHKDKCSLVLDSLEHFVPEHFGLPPFDFL
ncbi:pseudouridine-5'-phosphatase-like isoform X1 [Mytilus galloprovincialis]|uniref:pseudouridine-5'-phosphatase-like isoform X1 n=1 Tax=Mytilus galloprovincialis TaxID=29158 RepID=UPI003F7C2D51